MKRKTRLYDKQFKLNAVKLYLENGASYKAVAKDLGIPDSTLITWVKSFKHDEEELPDQVKLSVSDRELIALKHELEIVKEERDILKKALGIFSSRRK